MTEEIEVKIFGQTFRITAGEAPPAYVQRLAAYVDEKMHTISAAAKNSSVNRLALLTALNVADDFFKLQAYSEQSSHLFHEQTDRLIALIQKQLADDES